MAISVTLAAWLLAAVVLACVVAFAATLTASDARREWREAVFARERSDNLVRLADSRLLSERDSWNRSDAATRQRHIDQLKAKEQRETHLLAEMVAAEARFAAYREATARYVDELETQLAARKSPTRTRRK